MLNVEPVSESVSVGDVVADAGFISGVDPQSIATCFVLDVDLPSIKPKFMPQYETMFEDERAEDSADDQPVPELSNRNKVLLQRALVEHAPEVPDCQDLSHAHRFAADGLRFDDSVPLINHDNVIIQKGIIFKTMEAMKIWLTEYAVFHHHPFMVKHSDENKRYVITCRRGCPSIVCARKGKDDSWRITSVVQPHTCVTNVNNRKHLQLSSRFISEKLVKIIKNSPLMTVMTLIEVVMIAWGYRVKYGRACRTKQRALKLIYCDWVEAYEALPAMLHAMKAKNPGMHFEYVRKPDVMGPEGRSISSMHSGHLDSALKHSSIVVICCLLMAHS
jgi:hypothetical protein